MPFYTTPNQLKNAPFYPLIDKSILGQDKLPANFYDLPFFGDPTQLTTGNTALPTDISQQFISYSSDGGRTTTQLTATQLATRINGTLAATPNAIPSANYTIEQLAPLWQQFFYVYAPFISNEIYNTATQSVTDSNVYIENFNYYNQLFGRCVKQFLNAGHSITDSLADYLAGHNVIPFGSSAVPTPSTDANSMKLRQHNVIVWQFSRVVAMIDRLNTRTSHAGTREVMWNQVAAEALREMNLQSIPSVHPSSENVKIPDPDSVQAQNDMLNQIESYRSQFKTADQKAQLEDSTLSSANDATQQQRTTLDSFWTTLDSIMNSLLN